MNTYYVYTARMSPTLNLHKSASNACSYAIEIRNRILFDFYTAGTVTYYYPVDTIVFSYSLAMKYHTMLVLLHGPWCYMMYPSNHDVL